MTYMEFLTNVANGELNDEVMAQATSLLEKENTAKANARAKAAEKTAQAAVERQPVIDALVGALTDEPKTAKMLVEELAADGFTLTPQGVSSYLNRYAKGAFEKTKDAEKHVAYTIAR